MAIKKNDVVLVEIKPIEMVDVPVRIVGDSPLIVHAWSEKAKRMILEKNQNKANGKKKEAQNPVEDFVNSMYWLSDKPTEYTEEAFEAAIANGARFGFPITAFKQAAVSAAYRMGWVKDKMGLRGAFFLTGTDNDFTEIKGCVPKMREDMVKIGMGTADIRYRGEFENWYADMNIRYNRNGAYSLEQVINIFNAGGTVCGIGEWRPERDGQNGLYHIETL